MKRFLVFLMALCMILASVSVAAMADDSLAYSKFDHVVEIHIGQSIPSSLPLGEGDTVEDNHYTRYLLEKYNIKVVTDWAAASGADYNQKVSMAVASNTLPDAVTGGLAQWKAAAKSGLLYDLTDLYEDYVSDLVKQILDSTDGRAYDLVCRDGKLYGIPSVNVETDGVIVMMIREDWLDQLGLEAPTTLDELHDVAKAFKDAKLGGENTIPIVGTSAGGKLYSYFASTMNANFGYDPIFAAMDAYPGFFLEEDGEVVYGSLTDNTRATIELLAQWYKEGLIDPEIGTRTDCWEPVNSGKAGIFFASWWCIGYGNPSSFINDENADWQAYPIFTNEGKWNIKQCFSAGTYIMMINAKASEEVAKACLILNNVLCGVESDMITGTTTNISYYPLRVPTSAADVCEYENRELTKLLKGETTVEDYNLSDTLYTFLYEDAKWTAEHVSGFTDVEDLHRCNFEITEDDGTWQRVYSILIGDRPVTKYTADKRVSSVTYTYDDVLEKYWSDLYTEELATMFSIITGKQDISAFDAFVEQWKAEGGNKILKSLKDSL